MIMTRQRGAIAECVHTRWILQEPLVLGSQNSSGTVLRSPSFPTVPLHHQCQLHLLLPLPRLLLHWHLSQLQRSQLAVHGPHMRNVANLKTHGANQVRVIARVLVLGNGWVVLHHPQMLLWRHKRLLLHQQHPLLFLRQQMQAADVVQSTSRRVTILLVHFAGRPRKTAEVHAANIGFLQERLMDVLRNGMLAPMMMTVVAQQHVAVMVHVLQMDGTTLHLQQQVPQYHHPQHQHLYQ